MFQNQKSKDPMNINKTFIEFAWYSDHQNLIEDAGKEL